MTTPDLTSTQTLEQGTLGALAQLLQDTAIGEHFTGRAHLTGHDPIIKSPHRLGEASATAQLLIGTAIAAIDQIRTGRSSDVSIDIVDALHFLHPTHYVAQSGYSMNVGAEHVAVNNCFATADNQWVMLEAGPPYAKLLDGYFNFFDCGNNHDSIARAVRAWNAHDLEDALSARGLPACIARTTDEWRRHPQGELLTAVPVVAIEKIADSNPVPFTTQDADLPPLNGLRVLDFTHVLAGPRSTRTLAEHGADVLHISSPTRRDTIAQHLGVDIGKRNAYLDLSRPDDRARMLELATTADVFTSTYRPEVVRRFGLTAEDLANTSRHGIVHVTADAYGHTGPWADRPGFDQNGQVATGFARTEGGDGPPRFSPVFYLADLITGYLAAAGTLAALLRRATEGGSYTVRLSLARSTMWVQDLGLLDPTEQHHLPEHDTYPTRLTAIPTT